MRDVIRHQPQRMNIPQTPAPVSILQVQPQSLHDVWPFVETGLIAIVRKARPDWLVPDVFANIRTSQAALYMVSRGPRMLGFFVTQTMRRPFSNKLEYFEWCAYTLPLRERLPDDNIPEAVALSIDFMRQQARALGCDRIVTLSRRPSYAVFGFRKTFITWEMPV